MERRGSSEHRPLSDRVKRNLGGNVSGSKRIESSDIVYALEMLTDLLVTDK